MGKYKVEVISRIDDGESIEVVELKEEGTFHDKNGSLYLIYGEERTTIKLSKDGSASIFKPSSLESRINLIPNQKTRSRYQTDYFPIAIDVQTQKVQHDLTQHGGVIRLHYTIEFDEDTKHTFRIKITVKEDTGCPK